MGQTTIEWTASYHSDGTISPGYTFNTWIGCQKISPGCKYCYAQTLDNRWNGGHWGANAPRKEMGEAYWKKPGIWNRQAQAKGSRIRVFCASMADIFEDHPDTMKPRKRLFELIPNTPWIDWLLLTKRPNLIRSLLPVKQLPVNVWLGTSVENQAEANTRIPELLSVEASVHFLSMEPLLGPVDLHQVNVLPQVETHTSNQDLVMGSCLGAGSVFPAGITWVIAGGESGHHARPMHPDWVRSIRDQCASAQTPFFFKQWGEWVDLNNWSDPAKTENDSPGADQARIISPKAVYHSWNQTPELRSYRVGKKASGRLLDGKLHADFPLMPSLI